MNNSLVGSGSLSNATDQQDLETSDDVEALKNATEYLLYLYEKEIGTQQPENKANYTRIFLKSFTQIWSNSFESRNEGWNKMERNRRIEVAETAMTQLESVGRSLGCFSADSNGVTTNGIVLETFDLKSGEVLFKPSGLPELKVHLKSSQITSGCGNTKMVGVGIAYVDLAPLLLKLTEADVSKITGFSINNRSKTELTNQDRVQIKFKVQNVSRRQLCSFWDFDRNVWSDEGCEEIEVGEDYVVCECNHLTNFAALASTVREVKPNRILSWITIVGCSLSSLGLIATIVCLTGFKALRCRRTTISCNLCGSLLVMNILILGGLERTQNKDVCRVIAMSLHYTLLASFLWMLMEGYFLYQMILVVFSDVLNIKLRWFYLLCYGSPIPIVAITAGSRYNSYISNYYCWLSIEHGVNWSFLGPALIIIFINTVVFVCAMKAASEVRKRKLHNTQAMAAGWLKGSFSMMCLLGLTWITGFFYIKDTKGFEIFLYLFTILNSFQGIFIFIFHVAMNEKARLTILTFWKTRKPKSGSDSSRKTIETIVGGGSCVSNQSNKRFSGSSMSSSFSSRAPIV